MSGKAALTAGLASQDFTKLPPVKTNAAAGLQPHVLCSDYKAATPVLKMHHPFCLHCKDLQATPKELTQMIKRSVADKFHSPIF